MSEGSFPLTITDPVFSQYKKQWGRRWRVTITSRQVIGPPAGINTTLPQFKFNEVLTIEQNGWLPEGMHVTFDTTQVINQAFWNCDVVIYNLNAQQSQTVINYGMTCKVEAGYMDGIFGTVFEGTIFQPLWEKERGVDWKLTLRCIVGMIEVADNFIGATVANGVTQRQLAAEMLGVAKTPLGLEIDPNIKDVRQTRAVTYFGQGNDLLQTIADTNNAILWYSHLEAHIMQLRQDEKVPQWEIGTDNGLIGNPNQTQDGAVMTMLMRPDLVLLGQIKITQGTVIRQMPRQAGPAGGPRPTIIPTDFTYVIGQIRHYGDSRGNDWYTDVTGFINAGEILSLRVQL